MTHVTCMLTATNRDQLWNTTLGNGVWATFTFFYLSGKFRSVSIYRLWAQLRNPLEFAPPFKFGTVPYGSTETNLMTHYPDIYAYMKKYSKANAIEGVKAVKDGSVQGAPKLLHTALMATIRSNLNRSSKFSH